MSSVNNSPTICLDHILALDDSCGRVRQSKNAESLSVGQRILRFARDLFSSGVKQNDVQEFNLYSPLIIREIEQLKEWQHNPEYVDQFYNKLKTLLHVKAKIDFTGWSKNIQNQPEYIKFVRNLELLAQHAVTGVRQWINNCSDSEKRIERHQIGRWIEADSLQLEFAGYSNEIAYKAEDVPLGAVILANPKALLIRDRLNGNGLSFSRLIQLIASFFYKLFTGLPVIHAIASMGKGHFVHLSSSSETTGKSVKGGYQPIPEDYSKETREAQGLGAKYFFGYEVMLPNHQKIGKALNLTSEQIAHGEVNHVLEQWRETIVSTTIPHPITAQEPKISDSRNIIAAIFNTKRPENYNSAEEFQSHPDYGYCCSGLISASLAKHGIDITESTNKKASKATPADFALTHLFDIGYSNDRATLQALRDET